MTESKKGIETQPANDSILLVDDNPTNLQVLLHTLNGRGYRLLVAKNGDLALSIARANRPALILLDIMMPGTDGYEVCRQLKADEHTKRISIAFLSALDDTKDKVKGFELGAVDYISKPFQAEEVIARVETHLKIHRLEAALSARNRQLEIENARILDSMREGIFGLDQTGRIRFVNGAAESMTGWSEEELSNASFYDMLMTDHKSSFEDSILYSVLSKAQAADIEDSTFKHKNGERFFVDCSCTPLLLDGQPNGAVVVFRDITEKKKAEQDLQNALDEVRAQRDKLAHVSRLSVMGEMAAGIAHEVNQPLTAIANYTQVCQRLLSGGDVNHENLSTVLEKIDIQARRAAEVIHRIRRFVRKPVHCIESVNPNKVIHDVVVLAEVDIRTHNIRIQEELADNLPRVRVDPIQIQQVALNLMRNGMEAMQDILYQDKVLCVKTCQIDACYVQVSVIDYGHGLAKDAHDKLFTPFYTTKADGVGIGLSICQSIIQSHGGKLWFERNQQGGSCFHFTIPID